MAESRRMNKSELYAHFERLGIKRAEAGAFFDELQRLPGRSCCGAASSCCRGSRSWWCSSVRSAWATTRRRGRGSRSRPGRWSRRASPSSSRTWSKRRCGGSRASAAWRTTSARTRRRRRRRRAVDHAGARPQPCLPALGRLLPEPAGTSGSAGRARPSCTSSGGSGARPAKGGHLTAFPAPPHRGPAATGAAGRRARELNVVDGCGRVARWVWP